MGAPSGVMGGFRLRKETTRQWRNRKWFGVRADRLLPGDLIALDRHNPANELWRPYAGETQNPMWSTIISVDTNDRGGVNIAHAPIADEYPTEGIAPCPGLVVCNEPPTEVIIRVKPYTPPPSYTSVDLT